MKDRTKNNAIKLDYKRTIFVGFAFMAIMMFWQVYDFAVPLMLDRTFGLSADMRGLVMGLDNLLALFLLPLFGALSDKCNSKTGRRTPFILAGTLLAVILTVSLALVENVQLAGLTANGVQDNASLVANGFLSPEYIGVEKFLEGGKILNPDYTTYVYPAQMAMAWAMTAQNPAVFASFIVLIVLLLVTMSVFRTPAVALMPDVTPKPLRSKANALITLMGGAGGLISTLMYTFLAKEYQNYITLFICLSAGMLITLILYMITVKEKKFVELRMREEERFHIVDEEETACEGVKMSKEKKISFLLILAVIFLWFMGYNAVLSHLSVYATRTLGFAEGDVGTITILSMAGGALALPAVGFLSTKIGRKKSIYIGLAVEAIAFIGMIFVTPESKAFIYAAFAIGGFAMSFVNVNTFPMVVEMSKGSNTGKYTGYYYATSMMAQAITPYLAGLVMKNFDKNQNFLFIYAVMFMLLAFILLCFVKHGDAKPPKPSSKMEYFGADGD